ncbi:hypothetical protein ACQEU6_39985 [Spirillospora sp. CA-108201]
MAASDGGSGTGRDGDGEDTDAGAAADGEDLAGHIRAVVDGLGPLTTEQGDVLALLFRADR